MDMPILIDYLTFTIKGDKNNNEPFVFKKQDVYDFMGLDAGEFYDIGPRMHYANCYENGKGIYIYEPYPDRKEEMGYCVKLSGNGCRYYEGIIKDGEFIESQKVWRWFFRKLRSLNYIGCFVNISRLDLAVDDISKGDKWFLDLDKIAASINSREFVSQFRNLDDWETHKISSGEYTGRTISFGNRKSATYCRFYDKLAEQCIKNGNNEEKMKELRNITHWVRMEFEFKRTQALKMVNVICDSVDFSDYFSEIVNGYIRFVEDDDENTSRKSMKKWWLEFIGTLKKSSLSTGNYKNYSYEKIVEYMDKYLSTTLYTVMSRMSPGDFFNRIALHAQGRLKKKHCQIIEGEGMERALESYEIWEKLNPVPYNRRMMVSNYV